MALGDELRTDDEVELPFLHIADRIAQRGHLRALQTRGQIAVPRKWLVYRYLKQQGLDNLWGVDSPQVMIRLLQLGRVQYLVADTMSVSTFAAEEGMPFDQLPGWVAAWNKVDPALLSITDVNRDGLLQRMSLRR